MAMPTTTHCMVREVSRTMLLRESCALGMTSPELVRLNTSLSSDRIMWKPLRCTPLEEQVDGGIMCEPCEGRGWLLCDFCKGQKTNVKSENNRIYRRCPSCRAVGYILCSKCKVFKCVTFPNYTDGDMA
ncbi:hypothetical protein AgCh_023683 [Apium graveolens]